MDPAEDETGEDRTTPLFSVVIVNYNSGDRLARCLEHLSSQTLSDFEIIIWDNASMDDSHSLQLSSARLFRSPENLGFAKANNQAVENAQGKWIAFLNPDAYPAPDWLEQMASAIKRYPGTDCFASRQLSADNPGVLDGAGDVLHITGLAYRGGFGRPAEEAKDDGEVFAACAAAAVYRATTFKELGGFEESFFCYVEDVDLGFRLRIAGGRCVFVASANVLHEGSGVTGRYSAFTVYHGYRNLLLMLLRCVPRSALALAPLFIIPYTLLLLRSATRGQGGAAFRALRDGLKGAPGALRERSNIHKGTARPDWWPLVALSPVSLWTRRAKLKPLR
ncbi:MAG: glycosyltransferase family 2 protein [Pseudomonadota bacterium]